jgi:hypothetical protein
VWSEVYRSAECPRNSQPSAQPSSLAHCKRHLANESVVESVVICEMSLYPRVAATALRLLRLINKHR